VLGCGPAVVAPANTTEKTSATPPAIVIGFMGGLVRHDNLVHSGVQLAASRGLPFGSTRGGF
jgi:hypothetical protein